MRDDKGEPTGVLIDNAMDVVVAKLPAVMGYGASNAYVSRIMSRVGVGVAASMIGIGLLASDVVSIRLPGDVTIAQWNA